MNSKILSWSFKIATIVAVALLLQNCKSLTDMYSNVQNVKFKLANVNNFTFAGVNISNISKLTDVSMSDGLRLGKAAMASQLPVEFVLNVDAKNVDKSGKTSNSTLTALDWILYIDDVRTVAGVVNEPITIPGSGQAATIPVRISLDLKEFFQNKSYTQLADIAMAIGGASGSSSRLKLDAKPTIKTSLGSFPYPGRLTIVDKAWN